jgi:ubiquinone/menaquinone biosynthesis C-methylase UbiE
MLFKKKVKSSSSTSTREEGVRDEESFWLKFVKTDRFLNNWCRSKPNPELNIEIDLLISFLGRENKKLRVLDIGSGPVSILSRCSNSENISLQSVDPLADFYKSILPSNISEYDVSVPELIEAENLTNKFNDKSFDLVHIRNALDHALDPIKCLEEMFTITKEEGLIVVHGFENEALWENWIGMHQWNLKIEGNSLVISDKNGTVGDTSHIFSGRTKTLLSRSSKLPNGKTWITYILEKLPD